MAIIINSQIRDPIWCSALMDREIRFSVTLRQYIGIFIATARIIPFQIQCPLIEITMKDSRGTLRIRIGTEETKKDLLRDINSNLSLSIFRDKYDLQDKIVETSIISKPNSLACLLKIFFKVFHLMEIFYSNFKGWFQILITISSEEIEGQTIWQIINTAFNIIKWDREEVSLSSMLTSKKRNRKVLTCNNSTSFLLLSMLERLEAAQYAYKILNKENSKLI